MINKNDFIENFNGLVIPEALVKLLDFENNISKNTYYSSGFELTLDLEKYGLRTISEDSEFLNSIFNFAYADNTGSMYGFWLREGIQNLNKTPIVVFGSEGGFHIIARDIFEFLQILTCDIEPMVSWERVIYFKDEENFEPSVSAEIYKEWLLENYKLPAISGANEIIQVAQKEFKVEFENWIKKFYSE